MHGRSLVYSSFLACDERIQAPTAVCPSPLADIYICGLCYGDGGRILDRHRRASGAHLQPVFAGTGPAVRNPLQFAAVRSAKRLVPGMARDRGDAADFHGSERDSRIFFLVPDGEDRPVGGAGPAKAVVRSHPRPVYIILRTTPNKLSRFPPGRELLRDRACRVIQLT